jgi:hypothetical protein
MMYQACQALALAEVTRRRLPWRLDSVMGEG